MQQSITVPAGQAITLRVAASDDVGLTRVEFYEESSGTPFDTVVVEGASASASTRVLLPAAPGVRTFRARVFDISPAYTEAVIRLDAVEAVAIDPAAPDWAALEATPGVLAGGTLVVDAPRAIAGLFVLDGSVVRHEPFTGTFDSKSVALDVAGPVWVECGGAIDVSGMGYPHGASYPLATVPGAGTGGSHVGEGGRWNEPASSTFGSVYFPSEGVAGGTRHG